MPRLVVAIVLLLLSPPSGPALAAVEPAVVGTWVLVEPADSNLEWEIRGDGSYVLRKDGAPLHEGRIGFAEGVWQLRSPLWRDGGIYRFQGERLMVLGSQGPGTWIRKAEDGAGQSAGTGGVPAAADPGGLGAYLDGLEALRAGDFAAAVAAFGAALERRGDDPGYVLARGAAGVLAERFDQAAADLQRYQRLGGQARERSREATLWTYALEAMTGRAVDPGHGILPPKSLQQQGQAATFTGVPGHVIQGGRDYPTDFASFLIYDMALPYGEAREAGRAPPRAAMAAIGRWFAHRNIARPALAPFNLAKARGHLEAGRFEEALTWAGFVRVVEPGRAEAALIEARARLGLGQPATARRAFTEALTLNGAAAEGYTGRALAAAELGDAVRAEADLATAGALGAAGQAAAEAARPGIEQALAETREDRPAVELLSALEQAARAGRSAGSLADGLVAPAEALHRAVGAQRLRYDELYQDRLHALEAALGAAPDDPERALALARYLTDEATLRGETVEPRRGAVPWRRQLSEQAELQRALALAEGALALAPRHVGALLQQATILSRLDREGEAEQAADRALDIAPDDPQALGLYAYYKARRANRLLRSAAALRQDSCSSSSWTEDRSDGVYRVTRTTCTPPSQADILRADRQEAEARALRERSRDAMARAIEATRGTYLGYLIQADAATWTGKPAAAREALEAAVALDPDDLRAHDALVDLAERQGDAVEAAGRRVARDGLLQTSAAPMLRLAWTQIARNQWQGARDSLARARVLDPEDARAPAYLALLQDAQGEPGAAASLALALALEQARFGLDQAVPGSGGMVQRDIAGLGLAIRLSLELAARARAAGDEAGALARLDRIAEAVPGLAPGWQATQMFSAMLPDPQVPLDRVPEPVNGATLVAEAELEAGRALAALGRAEAAMARYRAAVDLGPPTDRPSISAGGGDSNFAGDAGTPAGDALVEMIDLTMEQGDYQGAQALVERLGYMKLSDRQRRRANELSNALAKALDTGYGQPEPELDPYQQQQMAQARQAYGEMLDRLPPDPSLVGVWSMRALMPHMPGSGTLTVEAGGRFSFVPERGETRSGRLGLIQGVQLVMLGDDGRIDELFLEPQGPGHYQVTHMNGVQYDLRRQS